MSPSSDYVRAVPEQLTPWIPGDYLVLGTDGMGRSDERAELRRHFEVDGEFMVLAALYQLHRQGKLPAEQRFRRPSASSASTPQKPTRSGHELQQRVAPYEFRKRFTMATEIKLPVLGDGIDSGDILEVLVREGDQIQKEQGILELETDKATVEVPSSHAGRVTQVLVRQGETVKVGQTLIVVEEAGATPAAAPPATAQSGTCRENGPGGASRRRKNCQTAAAVPSAGSPRPRSPPGHSAGSHRLQPPAAAVRLAGR